MFRKPRENASSHAIPLTPSTGRPPTPSNGAPSKTPRPLTMASRTSSKPLTPRPNPKPSAPFPSRSSSGTKKLAGGLPKPLGKPNASILTFFKKVDNPLKDESIFLSQGAHDGPEIPSPEVLDAEIESLYADDRFNELGGSVKKRKTSNEDVAVDSPPADVLPAVEKTSNTKHRKRRAGPFLSDSDTDEETNGTEAENSEARYEKLDEIPIPRPKEEEASMDPWDDFDDAQNFLDDEYMGGEEFSERKWVAEQDRLEADGEEEYNGLSPDSPDIESQEMTPSCPICETSLSGLAPDDATRHVNGCLDDDPATTATEADRPTKLMPLDSHNRFARKAAIPRPGQANPFRVGGSTGSTGFDAIMSGNVEDAAWARAAAAEESSRGRPAYERTCPFYKIVPDFFICVDAFRFGAVQGCNAYFLSHFHSDHYVGLTSSWCHGPIYCSTVTANLVKQQLRVDSKWVVPLTFEERFEVPGTHGAAVTMIPANHCPGSSLFLFEKTIRKGSNPKVQRVLHCGDFRACPEHLAHPLLMPDVVDSITGRTKQQHIDVCYLDTTYLNPRYAFPPQGDVVKACADLCISLGDDNAPWEVARGSSSMANFVAAPPKVEDAAGKSNSRLLVVCGTYSIGKEKICLGIARALGSKIWAPPAKRRICAALEDEELSSFMTDNPREAQVHMQTLMEIRPETLLDYLESFQPHFSRVVGFRPTGWNYRPPNSRSTGSNPSVNTILTSPHWRSTFTAADMTPQRGSTRRAACFGVPYSEHSSFRELTLFACGLRIGKFIPTVNVGSKNSRSRMTAWIDKWQAERRKAGGVLDVSEKW